MKSTKIKCRRCRGTGAIMVQGMRAPIRCPLCQGVGSKPRPFNLAAHECLTRLGYAHSRVAGFWEDTGDAENGPDLSGYGEHDLYVGADEEVAIFDCGTADRAPPSPPAPY